MLLAALARTAEARVEDFHANAIAATLWGLTVAQQLPQPLLTRCAHAVAVMPEVGWQLVPAVHQGFGKAAVAQALGLCLPGTATLADIPSSVSTAGSGQGQLR